MSNLRWKLDSPDGIRGFHEATWGGNKVVHPKEDYDPVKGGAMEEFSNFARAEKAFLVISAALSAYDIGSTAISDYQAGDGYSRTIRVAADEGAGWGGALLGGEMGAADGCLIGGDMGGDLGCGVGGAIGGLVGSIVGYTYGTQAVENLFGQNSPNLPDLPSCNSLGNSVWGNGYGPPCGTSDQM